MLTNKTREGSGPEPRRLLAFHYSDSYEQWTPLTGNTHVPALVYEVVESVEGDGSTVYEGRIFDAATKEMIHTHPYQSTILGALAPWWSRETELDPPPELTGHATSEGDEDER